MRSGSALVEEPWDWIKPESSGLFVPGPGIFAGDEMSGVGRVELAVSSGDGESIYRVAAFFGAAKAVVKSLVEDGAFHSKSFKRGDHARIAIARIVLAFAGARSWFS